MKITSPCVVALTWTLQDSQGETLDALQEPDEFLVGGDDLLPAIDTALQKLNPGDLCLILVDQVEEALAHIGKRVAESGKE